MRRALAGAGAVVLLILVGIAAVSWTSGVTMTLVDESGRPASGAYVRYHYDGSLLNPVHPVTYVARGSVIVRADAGGRVRIPGRLHLRAPLPLSTPPRLFLDHVYVPRLHNAFGPIGEGTASRPGVFTLDDRREHVTIFDVSTEPEQWEASLRSLYGCILGTLSPVGSMAPAAPGDRQTLAHARELIGHLRGEHAAFLGRYGETRRERPPAPQWLSEQELQRWREQTDAHLAREPLWGPYVERMWRGNLKALEGLEIVER